MNWSDKHFKAAVIILLLALLSSVLLLGFLPKEEAADKVAYVNLERIFAEHPARKAAEKKLNQKAAEYQQKLEAEAEDISGLEQKKLLASYQDQLQDLETELLASVLKELETVITEIAAEKELKFVLEKEKVLFGGYDLTSEVLAKINSDW